MLAMTGGREGTEKEFGSFLAKAGLNSRVYPYTLFSIVKRLNGLRHCQFKSPANYIIKIAFVISPAAVGSRHSSLSGICSPIKAEVGKQPA